MRSRVAPMRSASGVAVDRFCCQKPEPWGGYFAGDDHSVANRGIGVAVQVVVLGGLCPCSSAVSMR